MIWDMVTRGIESLEEKYVYGCIGERLNGISGLQNREMQVLKMFNTKSFLIKLVGRRSEEY